MKAIALIIVASFFMAHASTHACTCSYEDVAESYASSDAVFSGTVVQTAWDRAQAHAVIEVYAVWKGEVGTTEVVQTQFATCGEPWREGETYLIFGGRASGNTFSTICSRSHPILVLSSDIFYLGEPPLLMNQSMTGNLGFRVGDNHLWLPMLGLVKSDLDTVSDRWVEHAQHGWIFIAQIDPASAWVWDPSIGWIWTSVDFGYWFWIITETHSGWFYFMPSEYISQSIWYYDLAKQEYILIPVH